MVTATNEAPAFAQQKNIEQEAHHQSNGHAKVNNWQQPGPAAFDFRSTALPPLIPMPILSD
jgi:hypothetical protein